MRWSPVSSGAGLELCVCNSYSSQSFTRTFLCPQSTVTIKWIGSGKSSFRECQQNPFEKEENISFCLSKNLTQKKGAFWPWGYESVFSSQGQVMRTCWWHSCGGKIHYPDFIPTAEAETGRCLLLFLTVFHAEQQVLIKKATFTTNIHLSCRDQDTVWAHSTEISTFSFSGCKRQSGGINIHRLPQVNVLLSKLHLFNFSNSEDHCAPVKASLPRFHSGIKWSGGTQ